MKTELFATLRPKEGCLSALQRSDLVRDAVPQEHATAMRQHIETCVLCHAKFADELHHYAAMATTPVPAKIMRQAPAPRLSKWWAVVGMAVPAAAALLLLTTPPAGDSVAPVLLKGSVALSATLTRDDVTLAEDTPLETVHDVKPGDRLQVRIVAALDRFVVVQGFENGVWTDYFTGPRPADGWVPVVIGVTDSGKTQLRLIVCASADEAAQHRDACEEKLYSLQ